MKECSIRLYILDNFAASTLNNLSPILVIQAMQGRVPLEIDVSQFTFLEEIINGFTIAGVPDVTWYCNSADGFTQGLFRSAEVAINVPQGTIQSREELIERLLGSDDTVDPNEGILYNLNILFLPEEEATATFGAPNVGAFVFKMIDDDQIYSPSGSDNMCLRDVFNKMYGQKKDRRGVQWDMTRDLINSVRGSYLELQFRMPRVHPNEKRFIVRRLGSKFADGMHNIILIPMIQNGRFHAMWMKQKMSDDDLMNRFESEILSETTLDYDCDPVRKVNCDGLKFDLSAHHIGYSFVFFDLETYVHSPSYLWTSRNEWSTWNWICQINFTTHTSG